MSDLWKRDGAFVTDETSPEMIVRQRFISTCQDEAITEIFKIVLCGVEMLDLASEINSLLGDRPLTSPYDRVYYSIGNILGHPALVVVDSDNSHTSPRAPRINGSVNRKNFTGIEITITSHRDAIKLIWEHVKGKFTNNEANTVRWWSRNEHGSANVKSIHLDPIKTKLLPEFYPYIKDPNKLAKDYLNSDESVMLLAGEPGTGKTTFLRHMICDNQIKADIIHDERLMESDNLFQDFLFESDSHVMIIEDADTILMAREDSQNKLMSRFLNIGDGLIKLPSKKLVFTTNISDFGRVDPALMRPGRCFDVIRTRALTKAETRKAAEAAGLPMPSPHKDHYTLAEIFATRPVAEVRRIGFGG